MKNRHSLLSLAIVVLISLQLISQITYQKTIGGTGDETNAYCTHTADGNILIAGHTTSGGAGGEDIFVMKTDTMMNIIWSKTYGGAADDFLVDRFPVGQVASPIFGMSDGGFALIGYTSSFGQGSSDFYLLRIDKDGNLLWSKTYGTNQIELGSTLNVFPNGDLLLGGDVLSGPFGSRDVYFVRTDSVGNTIWSKRLGKGSNDQIFNTQLTSDGGFIFAGATQSAGAGSFDTHLFKADANGNMQWSKVYGSSNNDSYNYVQELSGGGYIAAGYTQSFGAGGQDFLLSKVDATGNMLWSKTYGGTSNDVADHVIEAHDGGFAFVGPTQSFGAGNFDEMLIKTDGAGNLQWAKAYGGTGVEISRSLDELHGGGYHICGFTQSFGAGGFDVYAIRADANGNSGCNDATITPSVASPSLVTANFIPSFVTGGVQANAATQTGAIVFQQQTLCAFTPPLGSTCAAAIALPAHNSTTSQSINGTEQWFSFVADSSNVQIIINNTNPSQGYVNGITLYDGTCNGLMQLVVNNPMQSTNEVELFALGLKQGDIYYLKLNSTGGVHVEFNLTLDNPSNRPWCVTGTKPLNNLPDILNTTNEQVANEWIRTYINENSGLIAAFNYTIPVVVHIVSANPNAMPYQQIQSQITALNAAFAKIYNTPSYLNGQTHTNFAVNTRIQFCLAQNGAGITATEPGVIRHANTGLEMAIYNDATYEGLLSAATTSGTPTSTLSSLNYLNIWVTDNIVNPNLSPGPEGYATFPWEKTSTIDGIVIRSDIFGDNTISGNAYNLKALFIQGKILAHEVGHYLGLIHTFERGCTGTTGAGTPDDCELFGDAVCDTPPTNSTEFFCWKPLVNCIGFTPIREDYMSYSDDDCMNTFTAGQRDRMLAAIQLYRNNLASIPNQINTGIRGVNKCLPEILYAGFNSSLNVACTGQLINFSTYTGTGFLANSWTWDFGDGTITPTTTINISHIYNALGIYTVTLTAVNTNTNESVSTTKVITVSACNLNNPRNAQWYFPDFNSIDFSSGVPIPQSPSSIYGEGACSSICDNNGQLLFYTDGIHVWDRTHSLMPLNDPSLGGTLLSGSINVQNNPNMNISFNGSAMQGAIIVPDPSNANRYYVFYVSDIEAPGISMGLQYSIVDMTLNNGKGNLVGQLNRSPLNNYRTTEQLTAVPHCNGKDYWIIVHGVNNDPVNNPGVPITNLNQSLLAYHLSSNGLSPSPVVSNSTILGMPTNPGHQTAWVGEIHASPDGTLLAVTDRTQGLPNVKLYDFNATTGNCTFLNRFNASGLLIGVTFSSDSRFIYYQGPNGRISQSNTTSFTTVDIASATIPYSIVPRLGPNNQIYITQIKTGSVSENALGVIAFPNTLENGSNSVGYNSNGLQLLNNILLPVGNANVARQCRTTLPNLIDANPIAPLPTDFTLQAVACNAFMFSINNCWQQYTIAWDFGDGTSCTGSFNTPITCANTTGIFGTPSHTYSASGNYVVRCTISIGSFSFPAITKNINIQLSPPVIQGSSVVCTNAPFGSFYNVTSLSGTPIYNWTVTGGNIVSGQGTNSVQVNWTTNGLLSLTITNGACTYPIITKAVTVSQPPIVNAGPDLPACRISNVINATATSGTLPYTYTWSPTAGLSSTSSASVSANPTTLTTYVVTVVDANGCVNADDVEVHPKSLPIPLSISSSPSTTVCALSPVSLSANGASSYTWSPNAELNTSTGANVIANPSTTTTYTVTGTNSAGCSATATKTVTVNPTCCAAPVTYPNGYTWDLTEIGASNTITGTASIQGTVSINNNASLTIDAAELRMAPNAKIIVGKKAALIIQNNSHIYACSNMWDGIYLTDNTSTVIVKGNSLIEDALNAIAIAKKGGKYIIDNATFNRNKIAILAEGYTNKFTVGVNNTVKGTKFLCSKGAVVGAAKAKLKPPFSHLSSNIGISLTDMGRNSETDIIIGDFNSPNYFENLYYGVLATRTYLTVQNNTFKNLAGSYGNACQLGVVCPPPIPFGVGVYVVGDRDADRNIALVTGNKFTNCYNAINSNYYSTIAIHNNVIDNTTKGTPETLYANTGIKIVLPSHTTISATCLTSKITNCSIGVHVSGGNNRGQVNISGNEIRTGSINVDIGILVDNTYDNRMSTIINDNNITNAGTGILLNNLSATNTKTVNNNTIILNGLKPWGSGIGMYNSKVVNIDKNYIQCLPVSTSPNIRGIDITFNANCNIKNNTIEGTGTGLRIFGTNVPNTQYTCNVMYNTKNGVEFNQGNIGVQGSPSAASDNQWTGSFTNNMFENALGVRSNWYVRNNTNNSSYYPLTQTPNNFIPLTIAPSTGTCNNGCPNQPICFQAVLADELQNAPAAINIQENTFVRNQLLFDELDNNPALLKQGTKKDKTLKAFYDGLKTADIGKLGQIKKLLKSDNLLSAELENNSISGALTMISNQVLVNQAQIDWTKNDGITGLQKSELIGIATQCPITGGRGVFEARALLSIVSDTLIIYDDNCPDFSAAKLVNNSPALFTENNSTTTQAIKLYPNPNDGNMVLEYSITENENAVFEIYDIAGSLIEKYLLDAQQNSFNIRSQLLSNGVYQYKFIVNNKLLDANKIVIIKQ